ncbi:Pycsar system effector family protein [Methanobacterium petrolearium]|uniref:Pycsar system effector family protein n=1 Tax=Methanobacterium petrolearium TaxID=710190 RepID=UPI001AEA73B2|nr:Pycsar system effector family protein [Methanobacterium petrolearium]MBP1945205.1 hypothetical protein [Methanobacterium petrolearium]
MNDSIENIWKTFNSINDWVKFSDTKATVVLATNGVILSIIFANVSKFLSLLILYPTLILILASSLLIGVFLSLISIFYSIRCLIPRTNLKIVDKKNLLYYGDICKFDSPKKYSESANNLFMNEPKLKEQLFSQIFANSKIATIKYKRVKLAIIFLGLAIFFLIIPPILILSGMI